MHFPLDESDVPSTVENYATQNCVHGFPPNKSELLAFHLRFSTLIHSQAVFWKTLSLSIVKDYNLWGHSDTKSDSTPDCSHILSSSHLSGRNSS